MSFVIAAPEFVGSAASDLAGLGSMIGEAKQQPVICRYLTRGGW